MINHALVVVIGAAFLACEIATYESLLGNGAMWNTWIAVSALVMMVGIVARFVYGAVRRVRAR